MLKTDRALALSRVWLEARVAALTHVTVTAPFGELTRGDAASGEQATWGHNGAHMARILFQDPVRVAVPARQCLP